MERINEDFLAERMGHTDFDLLKGKPWKVPLKYTSTGRVRGACMHTAASDPTAC